MRKNKGWGWGRERGKLMGVEMRKGVKERKEREGDGKRSKE